MPCQLGHSHKTEDGVEPSFDGFAIRSLAVWVFGQEMRRVGVEPTGILRRADLQSACLPFAYRRDDLFMNREAGFHRKRGQETKIPVHRFYGVVENRMDQTGGQVHNTDQNRGREVSLQCRA